MLRMNDFPDTIPSLVPTLDDRMAFKIALRDFNKKLFHGDGESSLSSKSSSKAGASSPIFSYEESTSKIMHKPIVLVIETMGNKRMRFDASSLAKETVQNMETMQVPETL